MTLASLKVKSHLQCWRFTSKGSKIVVGSGASKSCLAIARGADNQAIIKGSEWLKVSVMKVLSNRNKAL